MTWEAKDVGVCVQRSCHSAGSYRLTVHSTERVNLLGPVQRGSSVLQWLYCRAHVLDAVDHLALGDNGALVDIANVDLLRGGKAR